MFRDHLFIFIALILFQEQSPTGLNQDFCDWVTSPPMQAYRRAPDKVSRFARLQSCVRDNMKWGKLRNHPTAWEDFIFVFYVIHEDSHNLLRSRWIYASLNVDCSLVVIVPTPLLTETSRRVCVCVGGENMRVKALQQDLVCAFFSPSGGLTTSWCLSATFSFTYHLPPHLPGGPPRVSCRASWPNQTIFAAWRTFGIRLPLVT